MVTLVTAVTVVTPDAGHWAGGCYHRHRVTRATDVATVTSVTAVTTQPFPEVSAIRIFTRLTGPVRNRRAAISPTRNPLTREGRRP